MFTSALFSTRLLAPLTSFRRRGRRRQHRRPLLGLQSLEPRLALAGLVTATLRGDELTLTGDDLSNTVEIRADGLGGIELGDAFNGTQFRHAGRTSPTLHVPAVGRLKIRLAGGDDQVRFLPPLAEAPFRLPGDFVPPHLRAEGPVVPADRPPLTFSSLDVDLGRGSDLLFARDLAVLGRATVKGGHGHDRFVIEDARFFQSLRLEAGDGNDSVAVGRDLRVAGGLEIDGGHGDDQILAGTRDRPAVGQSLGVEGGLSIRTGNGADLVEVLHVGVGRDLTINTGRHDDQVFCERTTTGGALSVATDHGSDSILLNATTSDRNTTLRPGAGDDVVVLADRIEVGGDLVVAKSAGSLRAATDELTTKRVAGRMVISSSAALNEINLVGLVVGRDLLVTTGRGPASVRIARSSAGGSVEVVTGAGNDTVSLQRVQAGRTRVLARGGDDWVLLEDVGGGRVEADGGRGTRDTLGILPPVAVSVIASGFEFAS